MIALHARLLIVTFWVGSLWTVGFLVAPTLFLTLQDRRMAGTIAGSIFRIEAWVSLVCGLALIALIKSGSGATTHRTAVRLIVAMLACTMLAHFGLQPMMAVLRESADAVTGMDAPAKLQFGMVHGVARVLYLIQCLLGVALIMKLQKA